MTKFFDKSWDEWISEYSESHQHPANKLCHKIGIPMIAISIPLMLSGWLSQMVLVTGIWLFIVGWLMQFVGHYFEKKPPEFFKDWRFLFVGLRWWLQNIGRK